MGARAATSLGIIALVVLLCMATPRAQATGAIRGRVDVRLPPPAVALGLDVASHAPPPATRQPDRRRAVVYLETAPQGAFEERPGARARIDQRNETFVPHVLAITVGTTVDFPNNDTTYHNVFSLSRARPFDLGRYPAGRSRAVTFDRPGVVRVFCDIHSHMSAFILVFSHRYFTVTDAEGRYRLERVPQGSYTVRVWNEAVPGASRNVRVTAGGETELDFVLGEGA